jgi:hypothetical protein
MNSGSSLGRGIRWLCVGILSGLGLFGVGVWVGRISYETTIPSTKLGRSAATGEPHADSGSSAGRSRSLGQAVPSAKNPGGERMTNSATIREEKRFMYDDGFVTALNANRRQDLPDPVG